ncbi:MAG: SDR family oxidoreductase [Chloroflexi bacterium]|nr:SDR family oxidoreductase [Chloroflexota bacterium]
MTTTAALSELFSLQGKVALVTGGTGVLGGAIAHGLAAAGAKVVILGRRGGKADEVVATIKANGGEALATAADVLDTAQLASARDTVLNQWGHIDILVNAAGGNSPEATVAPDGSFFAMKQEAFGKILDLNLMGTVLPSQVFGEVMAKAGSGSVINISSMAAQRPLTRVVGYAAAKAAIDNFTRWLALEMCMKYGPGLRVNAIAPGFFVGEQNRGFLLNKDNTLSPRGQQIVSHTPMGRFGEPEELIGAAVWLCSDAARFVTGIVVPVDGGFSAYAGV